MPRISTDNYDTVASWNGSQDLFVVEQPDGTKVATPAMVKQFMQAGDFEATGEVKDGHGNILKDMAKSADVATALAGKQNTLTFDNVPTENSSNPVKSGGVFSAIVNAVSVINQILTFTHFVQIPFTTGVLDSIEAAFNDNIIPIDLMGITFGIVTGAAGSQRVVVVAQNQRLSDNSTRFAAIYFGAYTAPRFVQKQDGSAWTDVAL